MKYLIAILFALTLTACGGGGGGGGGSTTANVAPNTDNPGDNNNGDNGDGDNMDNGDEAPVPSEHVTMIGIDNHNDYRVHYVENNQDETHNVKFAVNPAAHENRTTNSMWTGDLVDSFWPVEHRISNNFRTSGVFDLPFTDKSFEPAGLKMKFGTLLYYVPREPTDQESGLMFISAGGDTLNGLPSGTHHYGGNILNSKNAFYLAKGDVIGNDNLGRPKNPTILGNYVLSYGHFSLEADFDALTGTFDGGNNHNQEYLSGCLNSQTNTQCSTNFFSSKTFTGNININSTDGSFAGTGRVAITGITNSSHFTDEEKRHFESNAVINGNFHGDMAEGVSGLYYPEDGSYRYMGGFIAAKQ